MPTFHKRFPTGGIKSQERPFFKLKKFRKKFFDNAYFGRVISARDFCLFLRGTFLNHFFGGKNFFEKPTFASHFLKSIFWGKNL